MIARYLIIARYAEFTPDYKLNILGGDIDQIVADSYPYVHNQFIIATRIFLNRQEIQKENTVRGEIVDTETDELIGEAELGSIPKIARLPEGAEHLGVGFILQFSNVIFNKPGKYVIKLIVDSQMIATASLQVASSDYFGKLRTGFQDVFEGITADGSNDRGSDQ